MKTTRSEFSLKRPEDGNVILFIGIETGYVRKMHLEYMESVKYIINSENNQLYVNLERDYLVPLEIGYPSEWEAHYQNNISFSYKDGKRYYYYGRRNGRVKRFTRHYERVLIMVVTILLIPVMSNHKLYSQNPYDYAN